MGSNLAAAIKIHTPKNCSKTFEISYVVTIGMTLFYNKSFFRAGNIYIHLCAWDMLNP